MGYVQQGGINVSNDVHAFRASVDDFSKKKIKKAVAIALNRTADRVMTEAMRSIRQEYNVTARELRRGFKIKPRAWESSWRTAVVASGRPLNVIGFSPRQTKKGVSVVIKGGVRKIIPHAFIARITVPNGAGEYRGVFERKFKSGRGGERWGKYPIRSVSTVSVPGLFRKQIIGESLARIATDRFHTELAAAVRAIRSRGD